MLISGQRDTIGQAVAAVYQEVLLSLFLSLSLSLSRARFISLSLSRSLALSISVPCRVYGSRLGPPFDRVGGWVLSKSGRVDGWVGARALSKSGRVGVGAASLKRHKEKSINFVIESFFWKHINGSQLARSLARILEQSGTP